MITKNLDEKQRENLEAIREFTLMDDTFMTQVFSENTEAVEYLLSVILQRDDLEVLHTVTQMALPNIHGRAVRLDIYARDAENRHYDIEIQQSRDGAVPERARLNSSLFDAHLTESGQKYTDIPETYVIFITENDVFGYGMPVYNIERTVLQTGELFNDKEHIIYVNGAHREDDAVGQLMSDFHCADSRNIRSRVLADSVRYYKENPKGVGRMCEIMERIAEKRAKEAAEAAAEKAAKEAAKEAAEKAARDHASKMISSKKLSMEDVAEFTGLSIAEVLELAQSMNFSD